jgi:UDPglucose 6-dehydrogenase
MFKSLVAKKIAIFGFAFKPDTGDTRDAPAIRVCKSLLGEKACLSITDPHALDNARIELANTEGDVEYQPDPYKAAQNAHGIALLTEWAEYKDLDFQRIYDSMEKPAFIFDGRNHLDHAALFKIGFNVYPVGKPALHHF